MQPSQLEHFMRLALEEADSAQKNGEVPVGAVLVREDEIIARAHNLTEASNDASAHAELLTLRAGAKKLSSWRLTDCTLFVTLEPCTMCIGSLRLFRVPLIVFGARDPRLGAVGSLYNLAEDERLGPIPRVVEGILADESSSRLANFFAQQREKSKN